VNALLVTIILAQAVDAPLKDSSTETMRPAMELQAGEIVPFTGICLPDALAMRVARRLASAEAQVSAVEGKTVMSTPVLVGGVVALVVVSVRGQEVAIVVAG
jgi:hypothetical protein